jgi:hypothetical protein
MQTRANETRLKGDVVSVSRHADGHGFEVEVNVAGNESPNAADDFLRPKPGDRLKLYTVDAPSVKAGDHCRIGARLLGGPFGQRAILTSAEKIG